MLHSSIVHKKRFFSRKINNHGFTLVEVVVVSSVLVFLMSSIWLSAPARESDFIIMINQEKLRLLIMRAKSMTLSGIVPVGGDTCGHGVRIERNRAFIFLDRGRCEDIIINNSRVYNEGEEVPGAANIINLSRGVTFQPFIGVAPVSFVNIVFIPPDPRTVINGVDAINEVSVQIALPTGLHRRITINNQGLVDLPRN